LESAETIRRGLLFLYGICISEDEFQDLQEKFLSQNCEEFEDEDENKLIYTDIYNKYIDTLEGYICKRLEELQPGFTMSKLLTLIQ